MKKRDSNPAFFVSGYGMALEDNRKIPSENSGTGKKEIARIR